MLINLHSQPQPPQRVGHKAAKLMVLCANHFTVPTGWVIPATVFTKSLVTCGLDHALHDELAELSPDNVAKVATHLSDLLQSWRLPDALQAELHATLDPAQRYAVRSSGTAEDLSGLSFAGQYTSDLDVQGIAAITASVLDAYRAAFSARNLTYLLRAGLNPTQMAMAVIIQEMVPATTSGVLFTVNPVSGSMQPTVNLTAGVGENLMSGNVAASTHVYDDDNGHFQPAIESTVLPTAIQAECVSVAWRIQTLFGAPYDIEFAWAEGRGLCLLQARPITAIAATTPGQWSNANFRDGGVASSVCTPLMWSLYHASWEAALGGYFRDQDLFPGFDAPLITYEFGRPYWNVGAVKQVMAQFPGYVEADFDHELGITPPADGVGVTTKLQVSQLPRLIKIATRHTRQRNTFVKTAQAQYDRIKKRQDATAQALQRVTDEALPALWERTVTSDYLAVETTYFTQVYHNTIDQTLLKAQALKTLDTSEYLQLLGGLSDISHLRLQQGLWDYCHALVENQQVDWWEAKTPAELLAAYEAGTLPQQAQLAALIQRFGYHSAQELHVETPSFEEAPELLLRTISLMLQQPLPASPTAIAAQQAQRAAAVAEKWLAQVPVHQRRRLRKQLARLRQQLWWREEFKDCSTRQYALIHRASRQLAELFVRRGWLNDADDIWYATVEDIQQQLATPDAVAFQSLVARAKKVYTGWRNYTPPSDFGTARGTDPTSTAGGVSAVSGLGCSSGNVTGRVRVVQSVENLDAVQPGEILVTRFTDTGWTSLFPTLGGIVTETGGILCHAAVCAREYALPCIVCADHATNQLQTGMLVTIDGGQGTIRVEEASNDRNF